MRVAHLIARSDLFGANVHVLHLAENLVEYGIRSTVVVGGRGPFLEQLERRSIPYRVIAGLGREISLLRDPAAYRELVRTLREESCELVSSHAAKAGFIGRMAARRLKLPAVYTPHGWSFDEGVPRRQARLYLTLERLGARLPGTIVNVCERDRRFALSNHVGSPSQHVTIHNGVPDVPGPSRADPSAEPPNIVMVARFEPQKDPRLFVSALASLRELGWKAEIIGGGPDLEAVRQRVTSLGLVDRIQVPGTRSDVAERLAGAQIFVLTSKWEGFPLTVLEAMRAGLPVVSSDVGGVAEAIRHGRSGFLVPRGDSGALASFLERLIREPKLRENMGREARRTYEAQFSLQPMLEKTAAVYRELVRSNGRIAESA
jgi:glycosyltransferase involved in cell wall biosynthesis